MKVYPALRAQMGTWDYFIVKMRMRELAAEVHFAAEIYPDRTMDGAIQRVLSEGRTRKEIVGYLAGTDERFFASIVVASLDGNPTFQPIEIPGMFSNLLNDGLGLLSFDGTQRYFALDGQHRLKAIKTLLDPREDVSSMAPADFADEECSVLLIVKPSKLDTASFMKSYRRLFSSLNRYAKPTDADASIILDQDDTCAILTRRLISEYGFFQWERGQLGSPRVKTKGKNIREREGYFTSLQTLYQLTATLLKRTPLGTPGGDFTGFDLSKSSRSKDELVDELFAELCQIWDLILCELPELHQEPSKMRNHSLDCWNSECTEVTDHVLFWPMGQGVLARVVRAALDYARRVRIPIEHALGGLSKIDFRLHAPPWRHLLLCPPANESKSWAIRNVDRARAANVAAKILLWMMLPHGADEESLRMDWSRSLYPQLDAYEEEKQWRYILATRLRVQQKRSLVTAGPSACRS